MRPWAFVPTKMSTLRPALNNKTAAVNNLSLYIEQHKINIPSANEELIKQLNIYEYKYHGYRYTYNAPNGAHDDLASALMMAIYAIQKQWLNAPYGVNSINNLIGIL